MKQKKHCALWPFCWENKIRKIYFCQKYERDCGHSPLVLLWALIGLSICCSNIALAHNTARTMSFNLDKCIEQLMHCEMLGEIHVKEICEKLKEILIDESNIVQIKAPVTVVGDIQG